MKMQKQVMTAVVVGFALCAAGTAHAEVLFTDKREFNIEYFNECTGEIVSLQGEYRKIAYRLLFDDRPIETYQRLSIIGFGIGLDSGAEYVLSQTLVLQIIYPDGDGVAHTRTDTSVIRLIGLGGTPDEHLTVTTVSEVDEFGVITEMQITELRCLPPQP